MDIPVIEQAKIQAQVLVPLVKALRAELGAERANSLVRRALGDVYRRFGEEFSQTKNEKNSGRSWHLRSEHTPATTLSIIT